MSAQPELVRRLEQVENALADAQGRLPSVRGEVRAIREAIADVVARDPGPWATDSPPA